MNINNLASLIISVHNELQSRAKSAINVMHTLRNWLIGFNIVEYEQNGSDKAKYGDKLLEILSAKIKIKGLSVTSLKINRQFYISYPQISQTLSDQLKIKSQILSDDLSRKNIFQKLEMLPAILEKFNPKKIPQDKLIVPPVELISNLSFSHFVELIKIREDLKRTFYEIECMKGTWSVNELKRQISSLYYERSGLSLDKEKLSKLANIDAQSENINLSLRNPMVFEFLDLPLHETIEESQLEKALMDNLQQFLLELGNGFCFEARQKRILIDDEYFYVDLVFYHRILKCHVLIELKAESFNHENIGQLNVYLQYYKDKISQKGDNPPIGILLCTESKPQMVRYALADKNNMLISQYKLQLPTEEELQEFIQKQLSDKSKKLK
ncbi:MAG: PDDEXK nuclease domain-containing protein [Melioribacteraceae bacterium]